MACSGHYVVKKVCLYSAYSIVYFLHLFLHVVVAVFNYLILLFVKATVYTLAYCYYARLLLGLL